MHNPYYYIFHFFQKVKSILLCCGMCIAFTSTLQAQESDIRIANEYFLKGDKEKARESWAKAKEMIERMGYHRRDKDVQEIEAQLAQISSLVSSRKHRRGRGSRR